MTLRPPRGRHAARGGERGARSRAGKIHPSGVAAFPNHGDWGLRAIERSKAAARCDARRPWPRRASWERGRGGLADAVFRPPITVLRPRGVGGRARRIPKSRQQWRPRSRHRGWRLLTDDGGTRGQPPALQRRPRGDGGAPSRCPSICTRGRPKRGREREPHKRCAGPGLGY